MGQNQASFGISRPFTGRLTVAESDPLFSALHEGRVIRLSYRGRWVGAFFVENLETRAGDAGLTKTASGRGGLAMLERALVWYDPQAPTSQREMSGTPGEILNTLISEAQARGAIPLPLVITWTDQADSAGQAWDGTETITLRVGETLLDVIRKYWERGHYIRSRWNFEQSQVELDWYQQYGEDKRDTVRIRPQDSTRMERRRDMTRMATVYLVRGSGGFVEVSDSQSVGQWGRVERLVELETLPNDQAAALAGEVLASEASPLETITVTYLDTDQNPRPILDFDLGDTVSILMPDTGQWEAWRVVGFTLDFHDGGRALVTLELNREPPDPDLELARATQRVTRGQTREVATTRAVGDDLEAHKGDTLAHRSLVVGDTGGDVVGTLTTAQVVGLQGRPVAATAPGPGQVLQWDGSQWAPATVTGGGGGGTTGLDALLLGRNLAPPTLDGWTVYDDDNGALEYAATSRGLELYHPGKEPYHVFGLWRPAPSPPYTIVALFIYDLAFSYNYMGGGLAVIDPSTDRDEYIRYTLGVNELQVLRSNSRTAWSATVASLKWDASDLPMYWCKLVDDGVNRQWYVSITGVRWALIYQAPRLEFMTPSMVAVVLNPQETKPMAMTVASFEIISGVV